MLLFLSTNRGDGMLRSQSWPRLDLELDSVEAVETVLVTEPPSHHVRRGGGGSVISVSQRNGIFYSLDETEPARCNSGNLVRGRTLPHLTTIQETEARTIDIPTLLTLVMRCKPKALDVLIVRFD